MASRQHTISHPATNPPKKQLKITGKPKQMLPKCLFTKVKTQHCHFPPATTTHPHNHRASARLDGVMLPQRQPEQLFRGGTQKNSTNTYKKYTKIHKTKTAVWLFASDRAVVPFSGIRVQGDKLGYPTHEPGAVAKCDENVTELVNGPWG